MLKNNFNGILYNLFIILRQYDVQKKLRIVKSFGENGRT
jgi:hypothetical protein